MPRRFIRNALILLSLLLCIATAASWIRSHSISERLAFRHYTVASDGVVIERLWSLRFSRGRLHLGFGRLRFEGMTRFQNGFIWSHRPPADRDARDYVKWSHLGFQYKRQDWSDFLDAWGLAIPHWFLIIVFGAAPTGWITKRYRLRQRSPRFCPTCGYDLRATPARCPECGTPAGTMQP